MNQSIKRTHLATLVRLLQLFVAKILCLHLYCGGSAIHWRAGPPSDPVLRISIEYDYKSVAFARILSRDIVSCIVSCALPSNCVLCPRHACSCLKQISCFRYQSILCALRDTRSAPRARYEVVGSARTTRQTVIACIHVVFACSACHTVV